MVSIADDVNREILRLWYAPEHGLVDRKPLMPLVYPELRGGGLLFVGLNPSFSEKAFRSFLVGSEWEDFDPQTFYAWRDRCDDFDVHRAQRVEAAALAAYEHYRRFARLAASLETQWVHVDVFTLRDTSQKAALSQILRGGARELVCTNLNGFGRAQLGLCTRLIQRLAPELLVVANAAASRLLVEALDGTFDEAAGHHVVRLGDRIVPAFFSSMWTQGALDAFSAQRLEWQIRRVYRERAAATAR